MYVIADRDEHVIVRVDLVAHGQVLQLNRQIECDETVACGYISMVDMQGFEIGQCGGNLSAEECRGRIDAVVHLFLLLVMLQVLIQIDAREIERFGEQRDGRFSTEAVRMDNVWMAQRTQETDFVEERDPEVRSSWVNTRHVEIDANLLRLNGGIGNEAPNGDGCH